MVLTLSCSNLFNFAQSTVDYCYLCCIVHVYACLVPVCNYTVQYSTVQYSTVQLYLLSFPSYNTFKIEVCVYHGGKSICKKVLSPPAKLTKNFFSTITWSKWYVMNNAI